MPPRRMSHPSRTGKPAPNTPAPAGSYALPGGGPGGADAYPVHDRKHAANALSRVSANGTPAEKAKVRAAVKRKYPDLPSSKGEGSSSTAKDSPASTKKARPARKS
jgi:hypothetical protein